jgi:hypothetical protein
VRSAFPVFVFAGPFLLLAFAQPHQQPAHARNAGICGPLDAQSFRCPKFGFTYKVPFGWVDRTSEMQEASPEAPAGKSSPRSGSETLLAVFERPPGAPGETINSAAVIAAETLAGYPGVKTAADYFGPITEVAEKQGFKADGAPYVFAVGGKQLVRGDFSKTRGKLEMHQSSLVMVEKGNVISFTFIAGGDEELDDLIRNLKFGAHTAAR